MSDDQQRRLDSWSTRLAAAMDAARSRSRAGHEPPGSRQPVVGPPATEEELAHAEAVSGAPIPGSLRRLFKIARSFDAGWYLEGVEPPEPFADTIAGGCEWSVRQVPTLLDDYRGWVREVFKDPADPYDAIWHDEYPFLDVANGDIVALDRDDRVVYLSHDGGEGHGFVLGADVFEFLESWTMLGCPGPEDWVWLPFAHSDAPGLDVDGGNARAWRSWLGIP